MTHVRPFAPLALALAAALSLHAFEAAAQESPAPVALTLSDAMRRAAEDPPAVRVALARAHAAEAQIATARAAYLPTVGVSGTGSMGFSDQPVLANVRYQSVTASVGASATARMTLWDFGRTAANVDAATHGAAASRVDLDTARVQAMAQVAQAYLTVLNDREAVATARTTVTQREAHLRIAEGLVTAGARPPVERVRAALDLDAARLDLTAAEARERGDRTALASALGLDPLRPLALEAVDARALAADDDPARAATRAMARPEFEAARRRVLQAESQVEAARAARRPSLAAQASASVNYAQALTGQGALGLSENASAGLTLTVPVFDATIGANVRNAEASLVTARETLAQQSLAVRTAAVQAATSLQASRASLDQSRRLAETAAANLAQIEGRYTAGVATLLELVDAQATDASARTAVVRAELAAQIAAVNLLAATDALRP